jgi:hypothetical protein
MDRLSRARSAPRARAEPIESKPQPRTSSASRTRPATAATARPAEKPKGKFAQAEPYFSLSEINTRFPFPFVVVDFLCFFQEN